jgi:hypothetical protein
MDVINTLAYNDATNTTVKRFTVQAPVETKFKETNTLAYFTTRSKNNIRGVL